MKLRYIKRQKISYQGKQYRQGDIIRTESLGDLPGNWFEVIEETERVEQTKKKKKKEVSQYGGDNKSSDKDLESQRRKSLH